MTKTKTTSKIFGTSIVAFAVLALMVPVNSAHATLVGDDVTITLLGADSNNNPQSPGVTDTVIVGPEPDFVWNDVDCGGDDNVSIDIEASTITVSIGGGFGNIFICDTIGTPLDAPLNFTITSLDWIDVPNAVLEDITVTSNPSALTTTQMVTGEHSVEITINAIDTQGGIVVFTLDKSVVEVEKSWTHTDYNWDQVCDGFVNATGSCVVSDVDNTEIGFRPANINTDDVLADPLTLDSNGNYTAYAQIHKNNKFSNTNPGAFYALTTAVTTSSLSSITVLENYTQCTNPDGNDNTDDGLLTFVSKKIDRNVKVAIADSDGNVTEITDFLYDGIDGEIVADLNSTEVLIDHEIPANSTIYVLVKFQDDLKGVDTGDGIFDEMCHNSETVVANIGGNDLGGVVAEADLRITNQQ